METNNNYRLKPTFGNSFETGWRVMADNFLRLFLVVLVVAILSGPTKIPHFNFNISDLHLHNLPFDWHGHWPALISLAPLGLLAGFFGLLAVLYSLLVVPVIEFGSKMIFVQAVRKIKPEFELLLKGFWENYLTIILANLLKVALVILGFIVLIIPGIIIGCRLAFVSYLVMDKKLDPIEAVEQSWKLTRGHGWKIFFMGLVSIFIIIFGLCLIIVGILPAIMWVSSSFASLYQSVLLEKEKPAEAAAA